MAKKIGKMTSPQNSVSDCYGKDPKFPSKGVKGGRSVDADATRKSTAPTPKTLGGRSVG